MNLVIDVAGSLQMRLIDKVCYNLEVEMLFQFKTISKSMTIVEFAATLVDEIREIHEIILQEVKRIKNDAPRCQSMYCKGRLNGRLKVTLASGAGFLKQASAIEDV